jgi:hypothetical protein
LNFHKHSNLKAMFGIIDNNANTQVFYTKGGTDFQVWQKPANAKFVSIFILGSGGGGGAGAANTVGSSKRGGGGGGSSGYSQGLFAASVLPDTLYLLVPKGGAGGSGSGVSGSAGALAHVAVRPDAVDFNGIMESGSVAAGGGLFGGNGGAASTVWTGGVLNNLGLVTATAGQAGANSGLSIPGVDITPLSITCGGPSGGNTSTTTPFVGGGVIGSGFLNTLPGGSPATGTGTGANGSSGFCSGLLFKGSKEPLFFTAGSGGGASQGGQGGRGGDSSFGCGGAGGGAGLTGTPGAGGNGGDGLIIITTW